MMMNLPTLNKDLQYLLAVSGGLDSMVMADLFRRSGLKFGVVHCNFQLRDIDSDADEVMVKEWCASHEIPFFSQRFQTLDYADQKGISIQEAARTLRYDYFKTCLNQWKYHFVVTGHHRDDAIETLLFHFFRGTGIRGLSSIPEQTDWLLRPLLNYSREEILKYAQDNQVIYREDRSNAETKYTRNKIRHEVIPQLEKTFPDLRKVLAKNIQRFKGSVEIYEDAVSLLRKKLLEQRGKDYYIPIRKLIKQKAIDVTLYELLKPFRFSWEQNLQAMKLLDSQSGATVSHEKFRIIRHRDFLILTEVKVEEADFVMIAQADCRIETAAYHLKISAKHTLTEHWPTDRHEIILDATTVEFPLILRKWKMGDYLYPFGMQKKKKVARVLIDLKMPIHEKENVRVLESGGRILWIAGIKQDHRTRVTNQTSEVYTIRFKDQIEKES